MSIEMDDEIRHCTALKGSAQGMEIIQGTTTAAEASGGAR